MLHARLAALVSLRTGQQPLDERASARPALSTGLGHAANPLRVAAQLPRPRWLLEGLVAPEGSLFRRLAVVFHGGLIVRCGKASPPSFVLLSNELGRQADNYPAPQGRVAAQHRGRRRQLYPRGQELAAGTGLECPMLQRGCACEARGGATG